MTDWKEKPANAVPWLGQTPQAVVKHDLYRYLTKKPLNITKPKTKQTCKKQI